MIWKLRFVFWVLWLTDIDDFWFAWQMAEAGEQERDYSVNIFGDDELLSPKEALLIELSYWGES